MPRDPVGTLATTETVAIPSTIPAPTIPSAALVASAVRYPGKMPRVYQAPEGWQRECYRHYAICGEARYAARFFGHALSRAVLGIGRATPDGDEEVTEGPAVDLLEELFSGKDGQAQMLEALGVHLTIAGECYLVGRSSVFDPDDPAVPFPDGQEHEVWEVLSILEVSEIGGTRQIKHAGYAPIDLTDEDVCIRVWIPDPADKVKADSPFRSMLPILREIEYLTLHIFTQAASRLAGAGLMFVDQNIDFPPPVDANGKPMAYINQAHGFMLSLAQVMEESLKNPGSAAARVPFIAAVPTETMKGDPAKLIQFWSQLDDKARDLRNDSIRRFALGLEMPPEQLLGMGSNPGTGGGSSNGVSHWGAWQIEEQTIKMFIEPILELIVNFLTVTYLRPLMVSEAGESILDGEKVTYNTSKLRLRPDRSKESQELYDRGWLKASIMLKENGFKETDMPDEEELKRWALLKILGASPSPEQLAAAAQVLGLNLPTGGHSSPSEQRGPAPVPSLEDHPTRPRTPEAATLLPAAEALVLRALERAGSRIRQTHKNVPVEAAAFAVHTKLAANGTSDKCLEGAWTTAPMVLGSIEGLDVASTVRALNTYCLNLLTTQKPHSRERLAEYLELT